MSSSSAVSEPHLWPRDSCEGGYRCGEELRGREDQYLWPVEKVSGARRDDSVPWPCVGPLLTSNDGQWLWAPGGWCWGQR